MSPVATEPLGAFLDASPTPAHAVESAATSLTGAGFTPHRDTDALKAGPGGHYIRRGGSLIAWRATDGAGPTAPFRIVAAHTDSPGFRIKPRPVTESAGCARLGVEVYGSPLVNSWLDRDLGVAGTVAVSAGDTSQIRLVRDARAVLRIPQLAIHLDRGVNEKGLSLDPQTQLQPMWGLGPADHDDFVSYVAELAGIASRDVSAWELAPYDLAPARTGGRNAELVSSARLDDLVSCHAALSALIDAEATDAAVGVVLLVDHEEVGSSSVTGANSAWVPRTFERISTALGAGRTQYLERLNASHAISADMAHATHPNYPERHDPAHPIVLGGGPVLKHNAQQRYATSLASAAPFRDACREAGVQLQEFVSHSSMPCGSTIGPSLAVGLGIPVVDVGVPQLAMHSVREVCAASDHAQLTRAFTRYLSRQ